MVSKRKLVVFFLGIAVVAAAVAQRVASHASRRAKATDSASQLLSDMAGREFVGSIHFRYRSTNQSTGRTTNQTGVVHYGPAGQRRLDLLLEGATEFVECCSVGGRAWMVWPKGPFVHRAPYPIPNPVDSTSWASQFSAQVGQTIQWSKLLLNSVAVLDVDKTSQVVSLAGDTLQIEFGRIPNQQTRFTARRTSDGSFALERVRLGGDHGWLFFEDNRTIVTGAMLPHRIRREYLDIVSEWTIELVEPFAEKDPVFNRLFEPPAARKPEHPELSGEMLYALDGIEHTTGWR